MEAHADTTERKKRVMDVGALFVSYAQATMFVQPRDGALDVPAQDSESTSVLGVASRNQRAHSSLEQFRAMRVGIISPVCHDERRATAWAPGLAPYRRDRVD